MRIFHLACIDKSRLSLYAIVPLAIEHVQKCVISNGSDGGSPNPKLVRGMYRPSIDKGNGRTDGCMVVVQIQTLYEVCIVRESKRVTAKPNIASQLCVAVVNIQKLPEDNQSIKVTTQPNAVGKETKVRWCDGGSNHNRTSLGPYPGSCQGPLAAASQHNDNHRYTTRRDCSVAVGIIGWNGRCRTEKLPL